jgi:hypothetical protein
MAVPGAQHLSGVPWNRRPVKGNEHQPGFATGDEQRRIIEAEP